MAFSRACSGGVRSWNVILSNALRCCLRLICNRHAIRRLITLSTQPDKNNIPTSYRQPSRLRTPLLLI